MNTGLEERIVKKASELFLMHGIKSVTMDYIAGEVGISKRTLYEVFRDKDALLLKTLIYQEELNRQERARLAQTCDNSFELSLKEYERISQRIRRVNRNYVRDLRRYHPKVVSFLEENRRIQMKRMVDITEEGIREGYIRPELNSRILSLLLQVQLEMMMNLEEIEENGFSFADVFETIVINYARGIATPKGLDLIERYTTKKEEKDREFLKNGEEQ